MPKKEETSIKTVVIKQRKTFDKLFEGFNRMKAISYVASPDLILDLFDKGYEEIEIVVGEDISTTFKDHLSQKPVNVTERLAEYTETGKLKIFFPKRTIHTKLYILENEERIRVIQTSANLTHTARKGVQINYCWYFDLSSKNKLLERFLSDYEIHKDKCNLFMEDLIELLKEENSDKDRAIKIWLQGYVEDVNSEAQEIINIVTEQALGLHEDLDESNPILSITLDKSPNIQKLVKSYLSPFDYKETSGMLTIKRANYLDHKKHGLPLMRVDLKRGTIVEGLNGKLLTRTEELPDKETVNRSLEHLEEYIHTVDLGKTKNSLMTKTNMFEGLLYVFTCPFFNEYLKRKRKEIGSVDLRGPRFLYLYGPSFNGKTTFLRFALQLLSGSQILPIPGRDLNKDRVLGASSKGTCFPLAFDDVPPSKWNKGGTMEDVCKNYWETMWRNESIFPQMIISSNTYNLKKWAQSRIKQITFDVHFSGDIQSKKKLSDCFSKDNQIFKWFSHLYIKHLNESTDVSEDELFISREVMKELYNYAGRPIPDFFPSEPVEKTWDQGKLNWIDIIDQFKKAEINEKDGYLYVKFDDDMMRQIPEYLGLLPQEVKYEQRGTAVRIDNPEEFIKWLRGDKDTFLSRIRKLLPFKNS